MTYSLDPLPRTDTPSDYVRLQFDPANIPAKRIVGLLACQRDPLLRVLDTQLISAQPAAAAAVPTQKGKGKSGASTPAEGVLWEVELDDTVIFPEGGGQPSDTGVLSIGDKTFRVEMCIRRKLDSVHLVRVPQGETLEPGSVRVEVDWDRRVDQMTIHTAQHLLSAVLDTYELPTLSWAMHAYPSLECPYVELPRQLTWREVEEVETRCNILIQEARRVWIEVGVQGEQDAEGRESRGLPKDYAGGVIRHCCIDQTDRNACCGTQLPNISLCRVLHVLPPSLAADSDKPSRSATKLFFTAGPRALQFLSRSSRQLSSVAQTLACSRENVVERAGRAEDGRKDASATSDALRKELARVIGGTLSGVAFCLRGEKSTHDFEFLGMVASAARDARLVVCLSAVDGVQGGLLLVQSGDDALAKRVKGELAGVLGVERVKGGGAKGRYMCKVEGKVGKRDREAVQGYVEGFA